MPKVSGIQPRDLTMIKKAYAFFDQKGKTNTCFTKKEIVQATGYKKSVVPKYVRREWRWCLAEEKKDTYRYTKLGCSEEEFVERHRGRWEQPAPVHVASKIIYMSKKPEAKTIHMWLLLLMIAIEWYKLSSNWGQWSNGIERWFKGKK
ncbi:MAG TPA: hypothetical protein VHV10_05380 [Ktedonobacteraceae bacterium]|nr:hypothetical protein [Ktedonobacteraceae bacterium]